MNHSGNSQDIILTSKASSQLSADDLHELDFSVLFEPVKIGPVVAKNRFFQTAHGCGSGYREPSVTVEIRRIKAEGGWGTVCTEQTEIHPSSDMSPYAGLRNWDDRDLPVLQAVADAIHQHGSLAALELAHCGINSSNLNSRETIFGPSASKVQQAVPAVLEPFQARPMDKRDIQEFRLWHRNAVKRGCVAGFDIMYVYAAQMLSLPHQFISTRHNRRNDEYGGELKNRIRLLRELIEDALDVVKGERAIAVRLTLDDFLSSKDKSHPDLQCAFELIGELPDLWDLTLSGWESDMAGTTRFDFDQSKIEIISQVRELTSKPIVTVRVFPTPTDMVRLVRQGVVDLVGSARQSIADPFLPMKLKNGNEADIRSCIKCNICVAGDLSYTNVRCTQNPTFGEEWRRGWHPETAPEKRSDSTFLIVGSGPAGLECARVLGQRGYAVTIVEARSELGGRVRRESELPLQRLSREVADYRIRAIEKLKNIDIKTNVLADEKYLLEHGVDHLVFATGAHWINGRTLPSVTDNSATKGHVNSVFTPDDIMDGTFPAGNVLIYDDDHYMMGGLIAELLVSRGCNIKFLTPASEVSAWTHLTMEQRYVQKRLIEAGVEIIPHQWLTKIEQNSAEFSCIFTTNKTSIEFDSIVLVTGRSPEDRLFRSLSCKSDQLSSKGIKSLRLIGDALVPGLIAQCVRSGHQLAREFDEEYQQVQRDIIIPQQTKDSRKAGSTR